MQLLARNIIIDLARDQSWVLVECPTSWITFSDPLQNPQFYLSKNRVMLDVYCKDSEVWMSEENIEELDYPNGRTDYSITHRESIMVHLADPESIVKIQEYLRNICQKS